MYWQNNVYDGICVMSNLEKKVPKNYKKHHINVDVVLKQNKAAYRAVHRIPGPLYQC